MRALICAVAALAIGCHGKSEAPTATAIDDLDALWKLAPDDALLGVVASPRAIAMTEHAWQDIHAYLEAAPELAAISRLVRDQLEELTGAPDPQLADLGLAPGHGAAVFVTRHGQVIAVLPVADRDKLVAALHGTRGGETDTIRGATCKLIGVRYVCASDPAALAAFGAGSGAGTRALLDKLAIVGARGDIELVEPNLPLQPSQPIDLAGVAQLERGTVVMRLAATGVSATTTASLGAPAHAPATAATSAGFAVMNLSRLLAQLPPLPVRSGVTLADLAHGIGDPLTAVIANGRLELDLQLPLTDPAPFAQVVAHCTDFRTLAALGATADATGCHLPLAQLGLALDGWVDGNTLHIGQRARTPPVVPAPPPTAIGAEMASGTWQVAVWGRGTLFAPIGASVPSAMLPDQIKLVMRGVGLVDEVGVGVHVDGTQVTALLAVRTLWANPDAVVARLSAIPVDAIASGHAAELGKMIAADAPTSPFAGDYAAGYGGLSLPAAVAGMLASVAIPAFTRYLDQSRAAAAAGSAAP